MFSMLDRLIYKVGIILWGGLFLFFLIGTTIYVPRSPFTILFQLLALIGIYFFIDSIVDKIRMKKLYREHEEYCKQKYGEY
ncbi:hypothetical protein [Senegalia massiliensis]|uniref:hypothetical protein n=1 Tax=Senegalia massiliensis TaxID=1720316 RepID=UPI0010312B3E|nr:hypothetical protein [Senegalia massiliensis]